MEIERCTRDFFSGWFFLFFSLASLVSAETTIQGTHSTVECGYTPSQNITIALEITYSLDPGDELSALGVEISLPTGWVYVSMGGEDIPNVGPVGGAGATGDIGFAWTTLPASPLNFTATVSVPGDAAGLQELASVIKYRIGAGSEQIVQMTPDPIQLYPAGAPSVVLPTDPANGATGVAKNATLSASFDKQMNQATITTNNFTLSCNGNVTGQVNYDPQTLTATFDPENDLESGATCQATISSQVESDCGELMGVDYTWSFEVIDYVGPSVTGTDPLDSAVYVGVDTVIAVSFDEAMDEGTITNDSFTVDYECGAERDVCDVSGDIVYESATDTATFTRMRTSIPRPSTR